MEPGTNSEKGRTTTVGAKELIGVAKEAIAKCDATKL